MSPESLLKTLSVRVKDKHATVLERMAFEVNQVWNLANEISHDAYRIPVPGVGWVNGGEWLSAFDIQKRLAGINKARGWVIRSATIQEVVAIHAKARNQFKRSKLRWRVSNGSRRSLGFIPFKARAARFENGKIRFAGQSFAVWDSYGLDCYKFRSGSFSQDARGRWYFNIVVETEKRTVPEGASAIGIDLGLKDVAVCSDGTRLENIQPYRELEQKLEMAQRAGKKHRARAIHARIRNQRKNALHQFSSRLVKQHAAIFVGNVSSLPLAKTRMAKSVLDAGWGMLRAQLKYKALARSVVFEEIDEAYTTQTCSCCGQIGPNSPKGRAGLGIREWTCHACGTTHDRDINAGRNILALGHERLAGGSPDFRYGVGVNLPGNCLFQHLTLCPMREVLRTNPSECAQVVPPV